MANSGEMNFLTLRICASSNANREVPFPWKDCFQLRKAVEGQMSIPHACAATICLWFRRVKQFGMKTELLGRRHRRERDQSACSVRLYNFV